MDKIFFNFRIICKVLIGHYYILYKFFFKLSNKVDKNLLINEDTELVIEGFPRVGNTFFVLAFKNICNNELVIAHYIHLSCQIKQGLKNEIPVIILFRDPIESIISLKVREPKFSLNVALFWYCFFYKFVLDNIQNKIVVKKFDSFINNFEEIKKRFDYIDTNKVDKNSMFARIDDINKNDKEITTLKNHLKSTRI